MALRMTELFDRLLRAIANIAKRISPERRLDGFLNGGKWKDGQALASYTYQHFPPSPRIVLNYMDVLDQKADDAKLKELFEKHSKLLENNVRWEWFKARQEWRIGDKREAMKKMKSLEPQLSDNPNFLLNLGIYYAINKDFVTAKSYFLRVTGRWPSMDEGWKNLEMVNRDLGLNSSDEKHEI